MTVVDASIVVRLLQSRDDDSGLRARFARHRRLHAPALIDAEVTSAVRGLLMTSKPEIRITDERAGQMLDDFADLPLLRYPMYPHRRRVLDLRDNFTAYDAFYVALAESLDMVLLTDDRKFEKVLAHTGVVETWR
ncbi:MAG: type II toxin-antitoxin system VapC family toxin [Dermatophilaceae bacterium]